MPGGQVQWHTGQYMARQTIFGQFSSQDTNVEHNSGMDESSVGQEVNEEAIYEEEDFELIESENHVEDDDEEIGDHFHM